MSDFAPLWSRNAHLPTTRRADVLLVCFSKGPLGDLALDPRRFGVPSSHSVEMLEIRRQERAASPELFDGWRGEALRRIAERDLGEDVALLDGIDECHLVHAAVEDRDALDYLQAAWAIARWMCARGATIVLDAHAVRFWRGADVAAIPADAAFDVAREVSFILGSERSVGPGGHYLHTRGMVKFGRPDLVAICSSEDADVVLEMMKEVAMGMARGLMAASRRYGVELVPGLAICLGEPTPQVDVAKLELDNDATLLSLDDGKPCVGILRRLQERAPAG